MARENGDWLIKANRKIYRNEFFTLSVDDVVNPAGEDDEFATIKYKESVAIGVLDRDDELILTKQFRYALGRRNIEVAAGAVEGEDPLRAAKRELKEELGITAGNWTALGAVDANPSMTIDRKSLFLARQLSFAGPERESTEDIETYRISFTDACAMVEKGRITHDITCLLILKIREFLKYEEH